MSLINLFCQLYWFALIINLFLCLNKAIWYLQYILKDARPENALSSIPEILLELIPLQK